MPRTQGGARSSLALGYGPILSQVQSVVEPIDPLIDFLSDDIPILEQTPLELADTLFQDVSLDPAVTGFVAALDAITDVIDAIPTTDDNLGTQFGSLTLGDEKNVTTIDNLAE